MDTKYCMNCGHEQHDGKLKRTEIDYDGREYEIMCVNVVDLKKRNSNG